MENYKQKLSNFWSDWTLFEKAWLIISSIIMIALSLTWGDNLIALISGITGMISVVLCAKGKVLNYAFGLINALTYAYLCYGQHLYGELMYNTIYMVPIICIGFFTWRKHLSDANAEVKTRNLSLKGWVLLIVGTAIAVLAYQKFLLYIGGSLASMDSLSTVLSAIAALLMIARFSEQWLMWIVVNIVSLVMWGTVLINGDLSAIATVIMWSAYLFNSIYGYVNWRKLAR